MAINIYNTLSRSKEEFRPIVAGQVKMYVCGPTVYDYIHIGNARPVIFFDVVRRYLASIGYEVHYVVNFTDVDDKLIRKAEQLGKSVDEVANTFINAYLEDTKALGVEPANVHPRVTENMDEIIAFIDGLVAIDFAYEKEGDVFFRTARYHDYGKLSHQNLDELQYGIRIEVDERKERPQDFVLWKKAKLGEISWESPWGSGRPGWHIECSAMALKYSGTTLDIHGGGQDLEFPHHECEAAQSEALNGEPLANYWMHNGYININDEKMSKSKGNGVNVKELLKTIRPAVLRYLMLSTHYRNPLNFSDDTIQQAISSVERIENCVSNLQYRLDKNIASTGINPTAPELNSMLELRIQQIRSVYHDKMQDDFNTADAITAVFDLVSETNQYLLQPSVDPEILKKLNQAFQEMNGVLGIYNVLKDAFLDDEIEQLIQERTAARASKNWKRSDDIRDLLQEKGVLLEDTPQGIRWRRK